jgi:hypothetical protein
MTIRVIPTVSFKYLIHNDYRDEAELAKLKENGKGRH